MVRIHACMDVQALDQFRSHAYWSCSPGIVSHIEKRLWFDVSSLQEVVTVAAELACKVGG